MKTHQVRTENGQLYAFEIGNTFIDRIGALKIVKRIPGVTVTRVPKFLSWFRESEFVQFTLDGQEFVIEEPFGDNSRYLVSREPPGPCVQMETVEKAFAEA